MPSRDGWHDGELAMHHMLHVPTRPNPTTPGLGASYAYRVAASPLVALGTLDAAGRPWTTVWGGEAGFARPVAQGVLGVVGTVDTVHDPVFRALWGRDAEGADEEHVIEGTAAEPQVFRPADGEGKMMSGLSIDLSTRDRVKLAGRMMAGAVLPRAPAKSAPEPGAGSESPAEGVAEVQLAMVVTESLGNCPKYLNKKDISPHAPQPEVASTTLPLPAEAVDLVHRADLFFLSSTSGETMDTNHRGGPPGLIRVVSNDAEKGVVLVYPEFSGNRLYQTLGNLQARPLIGIVVPDFETSDALFVSLLFPLPRTWV